MAFRPGLDTVLGMYATAFLLLLSALRDSTRGRAALQLELISLRHRLATTKRPSRRPSLRPTDRLLWVLLSRLLPNWREMLVIVKPVDDALLPGRHHQQADIGLAGDTYAMRGPQGLFTAGGEGSAQRLDQFAPGKGGLYRSLVEYFHSSVQALRVRGMRTKYRESEFPR